MPPIVQAKCPGCKKVLRIPADWLNQAIRCKHCGIVIEARPKSASVRSTESVVPSPAPAVAPSSQRAESTPFVSPDAAPAFNGAAANEPVAVPNAEGSPFAEVGAFPPLDDGAPIIRTPYRRRSRVAQMFTICLGLSFLALIGTGAYLGWRHRGTIKEKLVTVLDDSPTKDTNGSGNPSGQHLSGAESFPRRALVVCVSNYLYANPVSYGDGEKNVHMLMERLQKVLHIPPDQIVELSDARSPSPPKELAQATDKKSRSGKAVAASQSSAKPVVKTGEEKAGPAKTSAAAAPPAAPPLKHVVEKTIRTYLETCRPQDRILLLFIGHVVEVEDAAYLVPFEGELTDKETLIPLTWVYERLAQCKARQKVLILDTCRLDPSRGLERPGSGPMGAKLDGLLAKPPEGVQVWTACTAEQYSHELEGRSVFLAKMDEALPKVLTKIQGPQDPLPVEILAEAVDKSTETEVAAQVTVDGQKAKQTPRLSGKESAEGASYDKNEPPPAKVVVEKPSSSQEGAAKPKDIRDLLQEIDVPPIKLVRESTSPLRVEELMPFSAKVMQAYRADYNSLDENKDEDKYPLRAAVLQAIDILRKHAKFPLQEHFAGGNSEQLKKQIEEQQKPLARINGELSEALEKLNDLETKRDAEKSQRWQAHYDYVRAELMAHIVYVTEYNFVLGSIRRDALPALEAGQTGYRLASREKLGAGKEFQNLAKRSKEILANLAQKHKGTPWEVLARRERLTALGLEWQPTR
jgi:hypothetical protein